MTGKNSLNYTAYYLVITIVLALSLNGCKKVDIDLLERMRQMEQMEQNGPDQSDIENDDWNKKLRADILHFIRILDEKVEAGEKLGTYYKLIGLKYLDYSMFHLALEAFENALGIYPENPNWF